jgi:hypothetical protein
MLKACGFHVSGKVGLEVGTGWVPTVPLLHLLCGAKRLYLTDVVRYLDEQTLNLARHNIQLHAGLIERELQLPPSVIKEFFERIPRIQQGRLEYLAPVKWNSVRSASIDYVFSRAVLEHVPPGQIPELLAVVSRVLKTRGLMANIIDNSDHFQHKDKSISRLNFLKFSTTTWSLICALTDQQSRLRHSDYLEIFASSGFRIAHEEKYIDEDALVDLDRVPIHSEYHAIRPRGPGMSHLLLRA